MVNHRKNQFDWKGHIETLEDRRVMSADPLSGLLGTGIVHHAFDEAIVHHGFVEESRSIEHHLESGPDFWLDPNETYDLEARLGEIEQTLSSAHGTTGLNQVLSDYGFTGKGQTVAIIDSGIAYRHFALGGGLGANYRVVGGYDFTENDSDPYDDGPGGAHGTHVAGIVGGNAGSDHGVASGVDLVALRVFDDSGAGYMSWVESALQWVYQNRNSFANPITAVNLSLGVPGYNSSSPLITSLDDEFVQLKSAGIFISVSAGNDFASYNTPGLGNPASSPNVVPVMSVRDNGALAGYSQRATHAIAAPGSSIRSTVPDYKGNNNGIDDDYAVYSGTSMAAPYIAGASALIREAMQFVGYTGITQDTIYDHMMATATEFLDAATNLTFKRINIEAAINALMPSDDYGSTLATAFNLGTLTTTVSQNGLIGTLNDIDYFKFTADSNGTVTFSANNITHDLAAAWTVDGSSGTVSGNQGEVFTFDVVAGQTYTVGFSSSDGLGYYTLDASLESSFSYVDWGTVSYSQLTGLSVAGESWYRVQASQAGYLTVEGIYGAQGGQVNVMLYNANMQMVASGNAVNGTSRVDAYATAGEEFYICVQGTNNQVDYRLSNLVSVSGTTVNVAGTAGDDTFSFTAGNTHLVTVNGVTHQFASIAVSNVKFNGGAGTDSIVITGSSANEVALMGYQSAQLSSANLTVTSSKIENVEIIGGGGLDTAYLYGSSGVDTYTTYGDRVTMTGNGFSNQATDFDTTYGYGNTAGDVAHMYGSAGKDDYRTYDDRVIMSGAGYYNRAMGFKETYGYANSTNDVAWMYGSTGDDTYRTYGDRVVMSSSNYYNRATGFATTWGYANSVGDIAWIYGSAGSDKYYSSSTHSVMTGTGYYNSATGFKNTYAYADSSGDQAWMYGSPGDDTYRTYDDRVVMSGADYYNRATGFRMTYGFANSAGDTAWMYGSAGDDLYRTYDVRVVMSGSNFYNRADGFKQTYGFANSPGDIALMYDSVGDDHFRGYSNLSVMSGNGYYNRATGFAKVTGFASSGNDTVWLHDGTGNDTATVNNAGMTLALSSGILLEAKGFDTALLYGLNGGVNTLDVEAVDYYFATIGQWV